MHFKTLELDIGHNVQRTTKRTKHFYSSCTLTIVPRRDRGDPKFNSWLSAGTIFIALPSSMPSDRASLHFPWSIFPVQYSFPLRLCVKLFLHLLLCCTQPLKFPISTGSFLTLTPVAAKIAFPNAGATGGKPASPTPPGASSFSITKTSIAGASLIRIIR